MLHCPRMILILYWGNLFYLHVTYSVTAYLHYQMKACSKVHFSPNLLQSLFNTDKNTLSPKIFHFTLISLRDFYLSIIKLWYRVRRKHNGLVLMFLQIQFKISELKCVVVTFFNNCCAESALSDKINDFLQ